MATVAAAGAVEIFTAVFAVACNHVKNGVGVAIDSGLLTRAQKGCDVLYLIRGETEGRHAFPRADLFDHRTDFVAALVIECQRRSNQIRTAVAALRGGAVAKAAIADES